MTFRDLKPVVDWDKVAIHHINSREVINKWTPTGQINYYAITEKNKPTKEEDEFFNNYIRRGK